jgi:hypothetical protein
MRRLLVTSLGLVGALIIVGAVMGLAPNRTEALCLQPAEDGNWTNTDPNTRSITRISLRFVCQDVRLNGQLYPPGPPWHVHVFGACHPVDCDWGEAGARWTSSERIYAVYDQGFAKTYLWAKMSQYRSGQLWVYTWTDFADPARSDYGSQDWFGK